MNQTNMGSCTTQFARTSLQSTRTIALIQYIPHVKSIQKPV